MNIKAKRRLRFFDLGNKRCPICLRPFTRDAVRKGQTVTLEHVPPETLGGSERCLTCKPCNEKAGRRLDTAAVKADRAMKDREAGLGRKVVVNFCGSQQTGYFSKAGLDPEAIRRLPGSPDAKQLRERFLQQMDGKEIVLLVEGRRRPSSKWDANKGITIPAPREPPPKHAMASWLRSAYLLVFSLLGQGGYRYAESEAIRPIREQIRKPDEELVPSLFFYLSSPLPGDIVMIKNKQKPFCWVVKIGSIAVLLPHGGSANHYGEVVELAAQIKTVGDLRGLRYKPVSFGRRAELSLPKDSALVGQDLFGRDLTAPVDGHERRLVVANQQGLISTFLRAD